MNFAVFGAFAWIEPPVQEFGATSVVVDFFCCGPLYCALIVVQLKLFALPARPWT